MPASTAASISAAPNEQGSQVVTVVETNGTEVVYDTSYANAENALVRVAAHALKPLADVPTVNHGITRRPNDRDRRIAALKRELNELGETCW
jgi:hypothetical protein